MELDFKGIRITIVSTPFDLLASCRTLSMVAQATFDIDVDKGGDLVIFVSKKKSNALKDHLERQQRYVDVGSPPAAGLFRTFPCAG